MNTSLLLSIRDEIALEGLEGITFEALCLRLQERDQFYKQETNHGLLIASTTFDDKLKNLIFKIVIKEARNGMFLQLSLSIVNHAITLPQTLPRIVCT